MCFARHRSLREIGLARPSVAATLTVADCDLADVLTVDFARAAGLLGEK